MLRSRKLLQLQTFTVLFTRNVFATAALGAEDHVSNMEMTVVPN